MEKEIMIVLQNEDIEIDSIFQALLPDQKKHCESVADITVQLIEWAAADGMAQIDLILRENLHQAVLYHDIGMAFIPERLFLKKDDLTGPEYRVIQRHPTYGATLIDRYRKKNFNPASKQDFFLTMAAEIALSHHERWDGKGYPYGQSTTGIAVYVRAAAIADAYDSIIRGASYRMPLPPEYALLEIVQNAGKQFDPDLSEIFRKHMIRNLS